MTGKESPLENELQLFSKDGPGLGGFNYASSIKTIEKECSVR